LAQHLQYEDRSMSTTPISMPMPQQNAAAEQEYVRALLGQQTNTQGMTQMAPAMSPVAPAQRPTTPVGPQEVSAFGVGEKGAHQRQSMQNLVKTSQTLANTMTQAVQAKQQRDYQVTLTRYTQTVQGLNQAQAQLQQGQQAMQQATEALKKNPQDPQAQQQVKQAQQMIQQAQGAVQQNMTNLNDMTNDKKAHKIISKAFGIDDKNAQSPERQALIQMMQKQNPGMSQSAASLQSQMPQTQQLSPQEQAQSQMQQARVIGKPATQGQVLQTYSKMADAGIKAGLTQEKLDIEMNKRGLTFETDKDGERMYNEDGSPKLRPMTEEEVKQNPITKSQMDFKAAQTAAQKAAADAKTNPNNPELQIKAADSAAKMLAARASMLRAQKYVPGGGQSGQKQQTTDYLAKQLISGKMAPAELPAFGSARSEAMAAASKMDPNFNPAKADVQYKFANNPRVQQQLSLINSLTGYGDTKGSLDEVISQSSKIKRTKFPPVNSVEMSALIAGGDKEAAAYAAVATDVADQIGQVMAAGGTGGSSDFKLRQAQAVLSGKFNPQQLAATARELKTLLVNRQKAFLEQGGPFLKAQAEQTGAAKTGDNEIDSLPDAH